MEFEKIDKKYESVLLVSTALCYLVALGAALLILLLDTYIWCVAAECMIAVVGVTNILIVPRACRFKAYALREHDLSYRSGIIFPKITTIPFNRIQQVSVKQNPVSKFFGLYSVEVVNGAQALSSLTIPGLRKESADRIKGIILNKLQDEKN